MISDVECFFLVQILTICSSSLEKNPFVCIAHLKFGLVVFLLLGCMHSLCVLDITLCVIRD